MAGNAKLKARDLKVGDKREAVVVENLSRTQIVQYENDLATLERTLHANEAR